MSATSASRETIPSALRDPGSQALPDAACGLLRTLGYKSNRTIDVGSIDRNRLLRLTADTPDLLAPEGKV